MFLRYGVIVNLDLVEKNFGFKKSNTFLKI